MLEIVYMIIAMIQISKLNPNKLINLPGGPTKELSKTNITDNTKNT